MILDCRVRDFNPVKEMPKWKWDDDPFRCLAWYEDGAIRGGLRLFGRKLCTNSCEFWVAGIGGLFVVSDKRGLGIARQLIERAVRTLDSKDWVAVVAHSVRREDSVFTKCSFDVIGPSYSRPEDQDFFFRPLTRFGMKVAKWWIKPLEHF